MTPGGSSARPLYCSLMSRNRRDLHNARLRRDRIRREKHGERAGASAGETAPDLPPVSVGPRFAAERSLWQIEALMEGQKFESIEQLNEKLSDLTSGGRLPQLADAWKRDDPKWRAQQLAYDALETGDFEEALRLVHDALELDPGCTDAQRLMVSLLPAPLENKIDLMTEVVETAERNFSEEYLREHMGHFWGRVTTRPYMRAKQHLGELLVEAGRLEEGAAVFGRMLELNPNDSQGIRYQLVSLYLALRRTEQAADLMARFPDEERYAGSFAWARVLECWQAGRLEAAEAALAHARKLNPFCEKYIAGTCRPPDQGPEYFRPGEESEAQTCAKDLARASLNSAGFREWLQSVK